MIPGKTWFQAISSPQSQLSKKERKHLDFVVSIFLFPMQETRILQPYKDDSDTVDESVRLARKRKYEGLSKRIREYLNANFDALSSSNMNLAEFLADVGLTSIEDYLLAFRSTLKRSKLFLKSLPNAVLVNNY